MTEKTALSHGTAVLEKALDVIDAVAQVPQGMSQAALSQKLALPRTTLYRLLAKLVERGMIRHDAKRRVYALGSKCFELARQAYGNPDLVLAASPELRMLRDLTGETTYLAVLDEHEALALERFDGVHSQRSQSALGHRKPLHCTSQGKAMLAAMTPARREALIKSIDLKAVTPASITDRRKLAAEIRQTASRGWSIDNEEIVPGIRCVGAPIVDRKGQMRGAISIAGPTFRMTLERVEALGPEVVEAARRIGAQLPESSAKAKHPDVSVIEGGWAFRGEFPRWSRRSQCLYWADSLAPSVHALRGGQDQEIAVLESPIRALVLSGERLLVACETGHVWLPDLPGTAAAGNEPATVTAVVTPGLSPWPEQVPHSLCAARDGSIWACIAAGPRRWRVLRLDAALRPQESTGWALSEPLDALCWSIDGSILFGLHRDSGAILMMQPGQNAARRLATVPKGSGRLGGLVVDQRQRVWASLIDGWSVMRFSAEGLQEEVIGLPVPCPTDLCLGGADEDEVYITSARQPVALEALANAPLSGRLFCLRVPAAEAA